MHSARACTPSQVLALRAASADLPNDYLVALVGDMVTEEALPSYMGMLNRCEGGERKERGLSTALVGCTFRASVGTG